MVLSAVRDLTALLHPVDNEFRKSTQQMHRVIPILFILIFKWSILCFFSPF